MENHTQSVGLNSSIIRFRRKVAVGREMCKESDG